MHSHYSNLQIGRGGQIEGGRIRIFAQVQMDASCFGFLLKNALSPNRVQFV